MITSYKRGHLIRYNSSEWVYADNGVPVSKEERPCARCGKMPTSEGYDACIGYIDGAVSACCGHGVEKPYVIKKPDSQNSHPVGN